MIKRLILTISLIILSSLISFAEEKSVKIGGKYYQTISQSLEDAKEGDIIELGPGEYDEIVKINKKDITIKGANSNIPASSKDRKAESEIKAILIESPNTTIDGVKVVDVLPDRIIPSRKQSILINKIASNVIIKNSVFQLKEQIRNHNGIRLKMVSENISIENNTFENYDNAIYLEYQCSNIELKNNIVKNSIYGFTLQNPSGVNIEENEFFNTTGLKFTDNNKNENIKANVKTNKFIQPKGGLAVYIQEGNLDLSNNYWGSDNPNFETLISINSNHKPYYQDEFMTKPSNEIYNIKIENCPKRIKLGENITLKVKIEGGNDSDKTITWKSSNKEVAIIEDGAIKTKSVGEVDIVAKVGDKEDTCRLIVEERLSPPIDIPTTPPTTTYPTVPITPPIILPDIEHPSIDIPENIKLIDIHNHWAKYEIQAFVNQGYISGYTDKTFRPNNKITRAEFVILVNESIKLTEKGSEDFTDVEEDQWYYDDVCIAVEAGYINGYADKTFRPNEPITREEVAVIVTNLINIKGDVKLEFEDKNEIAKWAESSVDAVSSNKIMSGYINNTFRPQNAITRAEAVVTLSRI